MPRTRTNQPAALYVQVMGYAKGKTRQLRRHRFPGVALVDINAAMDGLVKAYEPRPAGPSGPGRSDDSAASSVRDATSSTRTRTRRQSPARRGRSARPV